MPKHGLGMAIATVIGKTSTCWAVQMGDFFIDNNYFTSIILVLVVPGRQKPQATADKGFRWC